MAETIATVKNTVTDTLLDEKARETLKERLKEEVEEHVSPEVRARLKPRTMEEVEQRIRRELEARIHYFAQRPEEIDDRLEELDSEWDIERLLEANAGALSLLGLTFGVVHKRWYLLTAAVGAFLLQHAVQGWCPPASVLRRLGIRTVQEISHERYALKALRGDFEDVRTDDENPEERARRAIEAADLSM